MCDYAERYLRTGMKTIQVNASLTTTNVQVLGYNPMRHGIFLPPCNGQSLFFEFYQQGGTIGVNGYFGTAPQIFLCRDEIGDIITYPIGMWVSTTPGTFRFEEISYDPNHFNWYQERMNEFVAKSSSW